MKVYKCIRSFPQNDDGFMRLGFHTSLLKAKRAAIAEMNFRKEPEDKMLKVVDWKEYIPGMWSHTDKYDVQYYIEEIEVE